MAIMYDIGAQPDDLAAYVGASIDEYLNDTLDTANAMVVTVLADHSLLTDPDGNGQYELTGIPDQIAQRAVLEVGSELYHRKNAPNGVAQFATLDSPAVKIARDPMVAARPILAPYLGGGFA